MSQTHAGQQSNLHIFSQTFNEYSNDAHFITQLHQKYGIPIIQLQRIYLNAKSKRYNQSEDTTELDYGQKLALNHNILKQMIDIIDNRSIITNQLRLSQSKETKRKNLKRQPRQVQEKLEQIKSKLYDLITFIGKQQDQKKESIEIKKVVNLSDINQASYFNASLQYSKEDFPQQSNSKQQKPIVIDRNRLDQAKEVTSQMILSNSVTESSKNSREKQTFLKSSLDRISEVLSGETIQRQFQQSRLRKTPIMPSQQSISVKRSSIVEENDEKLDETGKIILSTINKKITKTSKISEKSKETSKQNLPLNESNDNMKEQIRRSRFWKNKSGKLQTLAPNFAVSHQSIQDSKAFQRNRFKFDQFNKGFTLKSLDSIDKQKETLIQQNRKHVEKLASLHNNRQIFPFPHPNNYKNSLNNRFVFPPNKQIHESIIVKSFPNLKYQQSLNSPSQSNHLYHSQKHPIPTKAPEETKNQTIRNFSQQKININKGEYFTTHLIEDRLKKSAIPEQNQYLFKRTQSVPHFAVRQSIISQKSPRIVHYGNSNKLYTNASSHIIGDQSSKQQLVATRSYTQIKNSKLQPQPSKFINPYIKLIQPQKNPAGRPVTVYNDIRQDIANRSQSSKSSHTNKAIHHSQTPMVFTFNPNSNNSKIKKRGIFLTSGVQRTFSRRLT